MFSPKLSDIFGGIKEAIFFQRLFFWSDKGNDNEGWVYKTKDELELETSIPRTTQDRIRNKLIQLGVIEIKNAHPKGNTAPTLHYKINIEGLYRLIELKTQNGLFHNPEVGYSNDPKWVNPLYTEKTTEKTTDSQQSSNDDCDQTLNFSEKDLEMAKLLADLIKNNNPDWQLKGGIKTWATHIEKLHRIDGRTYKQIEYTIRWTQRDSFWQTNKLSTAKLRKQFNNLIPRMKADHEGSRRQIIGL